MKHFAVLAILGALTYLLFFKEENKYEAGYRDGYAEGYNSACMIRPTLVEGDWDNSTYTSGHNRGLVDGAADCIANKGR